jgi:hypothetical protein
MTSQTTPASFSTIPGELRNNIYHLFFESIFHDQNLTSDAVCRRVESLKPALALLVTSRAVRHEAAPLFWRDHVLRCHWGFGATGDDDARMASFANAARQHTLDVDITFQKRHLDTSSLGTNVAWLALLSTFDMSVSQSAETAREAQEAWQAGHDREGGIVSKRLVHVGSRQNAVTMKYTYHSRDYNYVMLRGYLAMLDWDYIFATAKANAALSALSSSVGGTGCASECTEDQINPPGVDASVGVVE